MIKLYEEYIKISSQLKDLIISDIEAAQDNYGITGRHIKGKYDQDNDHPESGAGIVRSH